MFEAIQSQLAASITRLSEQSLALATENSALRRENLDLTAALEQRNKAGTQPPEKGITLQYLAGLRRALQLCEGVYDAKPACATIQAELDSLYATLKREKDGNDKLPPEI